MRKILVVAATAIATIMMIGIGLALTQSTKTIPSSGVISKLSGQGLDQSEGWEVYIAQHVSIQLPNRNSFSTALFSTTLDFQ